MSSLVVVRLVMCENGIGANDCLSERRIVDVSMCSVCGCCQRVLCPLWF